jgi:hypothetical protein
MSEKQSVITVELTIDHDEEVSGEELAGAIEEELPGMTLLRRGLPGMAVSAVIDSVVQVSNE